MASKSATTQTLKPVLLLLSPGAAKGDDDKTFDKIDLGIYPSYETHAKKVCFPSILIMCRLLLHNIGKLQCI